MRIFLAALVVTVAVSVAVRAAARPKRYGCFQTHGRNSRKTQALFERRHLQGGGPTWSAILATVLKSYTSEMAARPMEDTPGFGAPVFVKYREHDTWYVLDDEAEGVVFCTPDKALLAQVRADHKRLNHSVEELDAIIGRIPAEELE